MRESAPESDSAGLADDLTRIAGIGPKIAHRLNAAGIRTYADLASRPASEIAKILPDSRLPSAKLDTWRGQAQELAAAAAAQPQTAAAADDGQHYASFIVRLLLNEDGSIRSTTVERIGTDDVHRWPGWEREALLDFIGTAATSSTPSQVPPEAVPPAEAPQASVPSAKVPPPNTDATPTQVMPGEGTRRPAEQLQPVPTTSSAPLATSPGPHKPDAAQRMRAVSSARLSAERTVLRAAERFAITMSLDFSGATVDADRLAYSAVIVAKPLTGGSKRTVARADGLFSAATSAIRIEAEGLPPGAYRLSGAVSIREPGTGHPAGLAAMAGGLIVQVLAS